MGAPLRHMLSRPEVRAIRTLYPTGRKRLGCPPPPQLPGPGGPKQSSRSSSGLESWVCNVCIFFARRGPSSVLAAHFSVVTGALANSRPRTLRTLPTPIIAHPANLRVSAPCPTANRTRSAPSSIVFIELPACPRRCPRRLPPGAARRRCHSDDSARRGLSSKEAGMVFNQGINCFLATTRSLSATSAESVERIRALRRLLLLRRLAKSLLLRHALRRTRLQHAPAVQSGGRRLTCGCPIWPIWPIGWVGCIACCCGKPICGCCGCITPGGVCARGI
eukprot:COSAG04_NODE_1947_length_5165_cov_4.526077_4_plen_277_part_00